MTDREKLIRELRKHCICIAKNDDCLKCNEEYKELCRSERELFKAAADELESVTLATDTNDGGKWISVEDEKPKRRGEYFVSYVFEGCDMRFYGSAFWHDDMETNGYVTGSHFSNEGMNGMKVTHWMELPKLPAGNPSVSLEADSSLCTREPLGADDEKEE